MCVRAHEGVESVRVRVCVVIRGERERGRRREGGDLNAFEVEERERERSGRLGGIWGCCEGKGEKGRGNLERANGVGQEGGWVGDECACLEGGGEREGRPSTGTRRVCAGRERFGTGSLRGIVR